MSHIPVMAMEMLWASHVLMVLSSVHAAHSHKDSYRLFCTNDFINNISCTWNSSVVGDGVDCLISGVKKVWNKMKPQSIIQSCKLKHHGNSLPGCSFVFENREFFISEVMPNISMKCNGTLVETIENYKPSHHIKMHPPGVPNVNSTANDTRISWSLGHSVSVYLKPHGFDFQVQLKQRNQTWKEARCFPTQQQELTTPNQQLKGHLQVRVRVKPVKRQNSQWSNWSPTTSWMGAPDRVNTSDNQEWWPNQTSLITAGLMILLCLLIVVLLALYRSCKASGLFKGKPVPNPSKYFDTLHSVHGGNLKEWLNPLSVSESFFIAQPCEQISPVEVCLDWDAGPSTSPSASSTSALLHFQNYSSVGSNIGRVACNSSSSSCFSNIGYFISSSSGGTVQIDPNLVYFTYQEDLHSLQPSICPSHTTCPPYESLKTEPHSPDSGFCFGKEDEGEGQMDLDVEDEQALDDLSSTLLILPLHLPSQMCPPYSPPSTSPHPVSVAQILSDSQQVDIPVTAAAGGSSVAWLVSGAMCRSSSMPVEHCKSGYLTVKELHTTFSNKSI